MSDFEKFKEGITQKRKVRSPITERKINDREYEHVLNIWEKNEVKIMKYCHDLYLKCGVL